MRHDEFYQLVQELAREESFRTALVVGGGGGAGGTEALLTGALANPNKPSVYCLAPSKGRIPQASKGRRSAVSWHQLAPSGGDLCGQVEGAIDAIRGEDGIVSFDFVLISTSALGRPLAGCVGQLDEAVSAAQIVLLEDTNAGNFERHQRLQLSPDHILLAENPGLRSGYGAFKRRGTGKAAEPAGVR